MEFLEGNSPIHLGWAGNKPVGGVIEVHSDYYILLNYRHYLIFYQGLLIGVLDNEGADGGGGKGRDKGGERVQ